MNTEGLSLNERYREMRSTWHYIVQALDEYERLGLKAPDSFRYYVVKTYQEMQGLAAWIIAMTDGAWAESEGAR